ncbi:MAG TPA: TetR family transcriptional regulator [Candidatus Dormibacteraeota bacterium]|nr:TetR family transcriptional regulator [Candidatus Dormibacteraeota bacterium]
MSPEEEKQRGGLTRERLVEAALALINEEGLEGLSMRALADQLQVKAASLYWHVRDRRELMELLADSILESVSRPRRTQDWRAGVMATAEALRKRVASQKDAERILLEVPEALQRSDTFRDLVGLLTNAGLESTEAADVALMAITYVIAGRAPIDVAPVVKAGAPASIAIDPGSRGVVLKAGPPDMTSLIRVPPDQATAAPAVVSGETVVVRRLRGMGRGEIELNPRHPWQFKVQAPTWNTVLDLAGLDVRGIHVDSGAANVECFLPAPTGNVPIHISSGVVNVWLHRAPDAAVVAIAHTGAVKLKLEDYSTKVVVADLHWQSAGALETRDRYELDVSSGVFDLKLDARAVRPERTSPAERPAKPWSRPPASAGKGSSANASALEILLDGVEARVQSRR